MKLYLLRHGESIDDIEDCYGGVADFPLTEAGRNATRAGEDACSPSKSDRDAGDALGVKEVLGANEGVQGSVKDDEECNYRILRDASVTRQDRQAVGSP